MMIFLFATNAQARFCILVLFCAILFMSSSYADTYEASGIKSPGEFKGSSKMPKPLKNLFLSLTPEKINKLSLSLIEEKGIVVKMKHEKDDMNGTWSYQGLKIIKPVIYPISRMSVRYRTPYTKGWSDPYHYLYIEYYFLKPDKTPSVCTVYIEIEYWADNLSDKDEKRFQQVSNNYNPQTNGAVNLNGIKTFTVADKLAVMDDYIESEDKIIWKRYDVIYGYKFFLDRFNVAVVSRGKNEGGSIPLGTFKDNPVWVKDYWPQFYVDICTTASYYRDVTPLAKEVVSAVKNVPGTVAEAVMPKNLKLSAEVSQIIDNPDFLINKKPALVALKVSWDNPECAKLNAQVDWTHNGKKEKSIPVIFKQSYSPNEIYKGDDTVFFPFVPDIYKDKDDRHSIEVIFKDIKDKNGKLITLKKDITLPVDSLGNPCINIRFVPVKIGNWDPKKIYFDQGERLSAEYFKKLRKNWLNFMRGIYPLPPESIVDSTSNNFFMEITPASSEKIITGVTKMGVLSRLEDYYNDCRAEKVNYIIGIVANGWMLEMGLTENAFPHAILINESAADTVLAHELGHHLNILSSKHNQDEYGKQVVADKGYWIMSVNPLSYIRYLPEGLKVKTIDFMDEDPGSSLTTWISRENYKRLIERISQMFGSYIKSTP